MHTCRVWADDNPERHSTLSPSLPGVVSLICSMLSVLCLGVRSTRLFCYLEAPLRKELGVIRCLYFSLGLLMFLKIDPSLVRFPN